MRPYLLIDFGSTYTKITAVDAGRPRLLGQAKAPTTVESDINIGLGNAMGRLREQLGGLPRFVAKLACSSAAGGLRMVAVGLVPDLTAKAAREAALGAGARVIATYAYELSAEELTELEQLHPDMILLAGGTDGGNTEVVLHNARRLASSSIAAPIVFVGNQTVRDEAVGLLTAAGKSVTSTANVMPRLHALNVDPAREAIRQLFLEHIIQAKGLDRVTEFIDDILMPTPAAVLKAAQLLSDGPGHGVDGLGPLAVIDIGGATTDVHSVSPSGALEPAVIFKGLEEPYAKRTVEGDLGMRISAPALLEVVGENRLLALLSQARVGDIPSDERKDEAHMEGQGLLQDIKRLGLDTDYVPEGAAEWRIDQALGRAAASEAMTRHAGRTTKIQTPAGLRYLQQGKDLRQLQWLVGTGGVFVHSPQPEFLFADTGHDPRCPSVLRPRSAAWMVDHDYLLAAMGLLAERESDAAFTLLRRHLSLVGPSE